MSDFSVKILSFPSLSLTVKLNSLSFSADFWDKLKKKFPVGLIAKTCSYFSCCLVKQITALNPTFALLIVSLS